MMPSVQNKVVKNMVKHTVIEPYPGDTLCYAENRCSCGNTMEYFFLLFKMSVQNLNRLIKSEENARQILNKSTVLLTTAL